MACARVKTSEAEAVEPSLARASSIAWRSAKTLGKAGSLQFQVRLME